MFPRIIVKSVLLISVCSFSFYPFLDSLFIHRVRLYILSLRCLKLFSKNSSMLSKVLNERSTRVMMDKLMTNALSSSPVQITFDDLELEVSAYSKLPAIRTLNYSKFLVIRSQVAFPLAKFPYSTQAKLPQLFELPVIRIKFLSPLELRITGSLLYLLFNNLVVLLVGLRFEILSF